MASKIIMFPTEKTATNRPSSRRTLDPKKRAEALPEWLQKLDVEWIFKEDARRAHQSNKR